MTPSPGLLDRLNCRELELELDVLSDQDTASFEGLVPDQTVLFAIQLAGGGERRTRRTYMSLSM